MDIKTIDIQKMSIIELKALAYDEAIRTDIAQKNLHLLQQQIDKKIKEEQEKKVEPDVIGK